MQFSTNSIEGVKADGLGSACFEYGEVSLGKADTFGQFIGAHFAFSQHHVQVNNNHDSNS